MHINSSSNFGTNNQPSNQPNDETTQPQNPSPPLTDVERIAAEPGTADTLAEVPPGATSVDTFETPNIFNVGANLGRDNRVELGLYTNVTLDGLLEATGSIGGNGPISVTGGPFGNNGSTYQNIGIGRSTGGVNDSNGFPVSNSPTDTRADGVTGVNMGLVTLSKPGESTYVDSLGNEKTVSSNHGVWGYNTDGTKVGDMPWFDSSIGIVGGVIGSEGTDRHGNTNSADIQIQTGFAGSAGLKAEQKFSDGLEVGLNAGGSAQLLAGVGLSVNSENPVNTAPESFNERGEPVGSRELPDQYSYNEQDQTITDWSSWFKDKVYPAENFNPDNPGTPTEERFPGVKESLGRLAFDTLDPVGKSLIDIGSKVQKVSNETFAAIDKAPGRLIDSYKESAINIGDSFMESVRRIPGGFEKARDVLVDSITNPRILVGSDENKPEK